MSTILKNSKTDYKDLSACIASNAATAPTKVAVYDASSNITYQELNNKSNQLANYIYNHTPGQIGNIAIYMERSIDCIVCLIAIMKSNNTYVPIDYEASLNQFEQIVSDCKPIILLASKPLKSAFEQIIKKYEIPIIDIWQSAELLKQMRVDPLPLVITNNIAYILYTSGTTGKPKGVQIPHSALINFLLSMKEKIKFVADDIFLAITPITFDISTAEIYIPLLTGASLVFVDNYVRYEPNKLAYFLSKFDVTTMQATPITWQMLIESGWKNESKIKVISGGEALSTTLAKKLKVISNDVWNFYGPTETTVWSTYYKIERVDDSKPVVSIGKPIANTQIYILNEKMQQQPVGEPGELYIGGAGVAVGYLNRPELNEKFFISNPFTQKKNDRLYKTGDLVLQDDEGNLHYLGRIDTQIKIRGHRIEAGAIENVMQSYPGIKECIVLDKSPEQKHELVAYLVLENDELSLKILQEHLKSQFPRYMIPTKYVVVEQFPVTANGKIDRKNIPHIKHYQYLSFKQNIAPLKNKFEEILLDLIQSFLQREDIDLEANFFDLGLHSMLLVNLAQALNRILNQPISVVALFEHPTIRDFADYLFTTHIDESEREQAAFEQQGLSNNLQISHIDDDIAVIGLACKVPGADNYKEFWELILQGKETIEFFNEEELKESNVPPSFFRRPDYVAARGILREIDQFDAEFFNYTPAEARIMDPQHRVFLEQAWTALEDAGYVASQFPGKIGVFAGMNDSTYLSNHLLKNSLITTDYDPQQILLATSTHYLATKIAYALGLSGASVTVNTACSTGLVSIAMGCNSLITHDVDMALAGAITIITPQKTGYLYQDLGILSPDGHCRVFDANSQGTVLSNGCGVVVLKRLSDALKDNDNILGVIKGWALNNDGLNKVGFTAPSVDGQIKCIKEALKRAKISPIAIEYIEAHGTGTLIGDPIEISALSKAYGYDSHQKKQYCAIGSVKANIGHTDSASGAIGFIKAILALHYKTLPPQINYSESNTNINFKRSPFYVNCEQRDWNTDHPKRLAAIHSLGFGGTNAHAILQEAPKVKTTASKKANLFIFSAKNEKSLYVMAQSHYEHILNMMKENTADSCLADMAYTLQLGREHFKWRVAIPYQTYEHLIHILNTPDLLKKYVSKPREKKFKRVIFGFVGQGSQYAGMAAGIYQEHPYFKKIVDECSHLLHSDLGMDLRDILFPKTEQEKNIANEKLRQTQYTQPALFVVEYALANLLISLGIRPDAMIGHSIGEYVAATISGALSLNEGLKLIAKRAQLMASTEPGMMLAVPLSYEDIKPHLSNQIALAAYNAPNLCVVSGSEKEIIFFRNYIKSLLPQELECKVLHTSHAFHSHMMRPIEEAFYELSLNYRLSAPKIPYISNVTGGWMDNRNIANKRYWTEHLRHTVMFSKGIKTLDLCADDIFIEIGPGQVLTQLIRQHGLSHNPVLLSSLPRAHEGNCHSYEYLLRTIGQLWLNQHNVLWVHLYTNEIRQRCAVPTYVFDRKSYWVNPDELLNNQRKDIVFNKDQGIFYKPIWERDRKNIHLEMLESCSIKRCLLIFCDKKEELTLLESVIQGRDIYWITSGREFKILGNQFIINSQEKEDYFKCLKKIQFKYDEYEVLHTWLLKKCIKSENALLQGPYSLLFFIQTFNEVYIDKPLKILVTTTQIYNVMGDEDLSPVKATILGPCKVIPQEQHNVAIKLIDLEYQVALNPELLSILVLELTTVLPQDFKQEIAFRGQYRWIKKLKACDKEILVTHNNRIRKHGVYLITGGLGGIGLSLADFLAKTYNANLILISRSKLPPENTWHDYIENERNKQSSLFPKIKKLLEIKKYAQSLRIESIGIENIVQLSAALKKVKVTFSQIHGVIHAAGIAGGGLSQLKTIDTYEKVLTPKVIGTANLIQYFQNEALDFFAFMSSITSVTGFPGQIDYCSANAVLDSYANSNHNFKHPVFCIGMNWLAWREVGMAAESQTLLLDLDEKNSIGVQEGCRLFEKMIHSQLNQVVITKDDLNLYEPPVISTLNEEGDVLTHSSTIETLGHLWKQILGVDKIDIDDDFYELGGHSLLAVSLLSKIRHQFDVKIPSTVLFEVKTIRGLATLLESYSQENETYSPLVVLRQGEPSIPPIFMFHPVGGTVFCYMQLADLLKTNRTIYAFQDPSIEAEKSLFTNIEEMATFYLEHIRKIQEHGPYYLCGASFGSLIVTEIAHRLEQENEKIEFIGIIDGWGKHGQANFDIDYVRQIIHLHLPKQYTGVDLDKQSLWESLLHQRLNMMLRYDYKSIKNEVILFKAQNLLSEYKAIEAPDNHWSKYISRLSIIIIPGDHNTMIQEPYVSVLAAKMDKYLSCIQF